jgi:hypothetical protein
VKPDRFTKAAQIEYAEAIVRLQPRDASALLNLGQFYASLGRSDEPLWRPRRAWRFTNQAVSAGGH